MKFAYKNLDVWVKAVDFAIEILDIVENIDSVRKHYRLFEQIEASSTSIPMNIAEGKGRYSKKMLKIDQHHTIAICLPLSFQPSALSLYLLSFAFQLSALSFEL